MRIEMIPNILELSALAVANRTQDVMEMCNIAKAYRCRATTVHPCFLGFTQKNTADHKEIHNNASISYPMGGDLTASKIYSAKQTELIGAHAVNIAMNMSAFLSANIKYVKQEIEALCNSISIPITMVIESSQLNQTELEACATMLSQTKAECIQIGSNVYEDALTLEDVEIAKEHIGSHQHVKVAGSFQSTDDILEAHALGAERFSLEWQTALPLLKEIDLKLHRDAPDIE